MAVTASAEQQKELLDLQGFDTKIFQLAHKRAGLPEISAAQDLEVELGSIKMRLVAAQTEASDLKLNQLKAVAIISKLMKVMRFQRSCLSGYEVCNVSVKRPSGGPSQPIPKMLSINFI